MHHRAAIELANGDQWTLSSNLAGHHILEQLYEGVPAFAALGDVGDFSSQRLPRLIYAYSYTFRRGDPDLANLTFARFLEGDWMPEYESPAWDALAAKVSNFVGQAFPHAVRKGKAILAAAKECQRLGLTELSIASSTSGPSEPPAQKVATVTPPLESTGSPSNTLPGVS
jgi:hypothetical protein